MANVEPELQEPLGLEDYLRVVRERAWIIVAAVIIGALAAFAYSQSVTPLYSASASLVYEKTNLDTALLGTQLTGESNRLRTLETAAAAVGQDVSIAEGVKTQLGSTESAEALSDMVSARADKDRDLITIEAVSADPGQAAGVANAFADQFVIYRQSAARKTVAAARDVVKEQLDALKPSELQGSYALMLQEKYETLRILESMQTGGYSVLSRAAVPQSPFTPRTTRNILLGLLVGLVVGAGLAFLIDYLDKRVKDERTLENELGVPVLAAIPDVDRRRRLGKDRGRSAAPVGFATHRSLLEPFRTLRSSLQYFSVENQRPVWLITSALSREGKTVTTINLALSLALSGKRVIVVEADLRRPMVDTYLGLGAREGLSDVLAGMKQPTEVLQLVKATDYLPAGGQNRQAEMGSRPMHRNLYVMASGPLPPNPAELLSSARMAKVVKELAETADCVLIDTPPVLLVSDALVLSKHVDGVILAARLNSTTRDEVREMRSLLDRAGVRVIGTVAGGTKRGPGYYRKRGYGGYKYGYDYGYEAEE